jgi:hypothetical protein
MAASDMHEELKARLAAVRRRKNLARLLQEIASAVLLLLASLLGALLLEQWLYLGPIPRTVIAVVLLAGGAALLVSRVLPPLGRLLHLLPDESDDATARAVGKAFPGIHDRLLNGIELLRMREEAEVPPGSLIDAALDDLRAQIDGVDFGALVDFAGPWRRVRRTALALAGAGVLALLFPAPFAGAALRLMHFSENFRPPSAFAFVVEPGNAVLVRGESARLLIRTPGVSLTDLTLLLEPEGNPFPQESTLRPAPDGLFRHTLSSVSVTTAYRVRARGVESDRFTLTVIDRPAVKNLRVSLAPPAYAGLPPSALDDNAGDIAALKGTRAAFRVEANRGLAGASLVLSDSTRIPLECSGRRASGALRIAKDVTYHVALRDSAGQESVNAIEYAIRILPDALPAVTIVSPGTNLDVTDNTSLPLLVKITDDFGFRALRLAYKLVQSRYEQAATDFTYVTIPLPPRTGTEALVPFIWNLQGLHLVPEDVVTYAAEVFDNDDISGPKSALSEFYTLRLPSLDEVFAEADKKQDAGIDRMAEALRQAQEARKDLEALEQDLKQNKEKLEWQEKNKADDVVRKYEEVKKAMEEISATVAGMTADLQKNQLLSPETMKKYQQLQEMLAQLASPEFAEAMKKLQQAMQEMNPEALRQAAQQFSFSEENFRQGIERTLNLLKRIHIEQKLDEAVRRAEAAAAAERELQKSTEGTAAADRKALADLARTQTEIAEKVEALRKESAALEKTMQEFPSEMPMAGMEEAGKEMNSGDLDKEMSGSAEALQGGEPSDASGHQDRAARSMEKTAASLKKLQQQMQQDQQRQVMGRMRKAMEDLLELSRREEELKNDTQGLDPNSQRFRENAQRQMEAMRDLGGVTEGLSALSQKTFSVTPEMGRSIGNALREMNGAIDALNRREKAGAVQSQEGAMASVNEAAQQLQGAMEAMRQGGGQGGGMAGLMQRLQRMAGQQQGINDGTKNIGGMTPEQAAAMGRLAAEQGAVRKSLEQLAREAAASGELSKLLGDFNRLAGEMREVQTDLAGGNVDPETVRKRRGSSPACLTHNGRRGNGTSKKNGNPHRALPRAVRVRGRST